MDPIPRRRLRPRSKAILRDIAAIGAFATLPACGMVVFDRETPDDEPHDEPASSGGETSSGNQAPAAQGTGASGSGGAPASVGASGDETSSADVATSSSGAGSGGSDPCGTGACAFSLATEWSVPIDDEKPTVLWDGVRAVGATDDGGVFAAVNRWLEDGGGPTFDAELRRFDSGGAVSWTVPSRIEALGLSSRGSEAVVLSDTADPRYAVAESFDAQGAAGWNEDALPSPEGSDAASIAHLADGRVAVGGALYLDDVPYGPHAALSWLSSQGSVLASTTMVASSWSLVSAVAATADGGAVAVVEHGGDVTIGDDTVVSSGGRDVTAIRWTASREIAWYAALGTPGDDRAARVAVGPDGTIVVARTIDGALVLTRIDDDGTVRDALDIGPALVDAVALAIDEAGNIVVAGTFQGTLDLDAHLLTSERVGTFVAKLDASGVPRAARTLGWEYDTIGLCGSYSPVSLAIGPGGHVFVGAGGCFTNGSGIMKLEP